MNETIRRFSEPSDEINIERLTSLSQKAFSLVDSHLSFVYVDDDGDVITISSNDELQEAVSVMTAMNNGKPKLQFKLLQETARSRLPSLSHLASEESKSSDPEVKKPRIIHSRVTCDGCDMHPIEGTR